MAWGIPSNLEFTPMKVLKYEGGYLVIGVDGELQKISTEGNLIGNPTKPFPTPISHAIIIDNMLIATWLDQELMLARMSALDLSEEFKQGVNRGDLRVRQTIDKSIHPAGNKWSHVLDSEPLSMSSNDNSFTFVLWRKGIYNLGSDALENWRSAEAHWPSLKKIPRAMETVATTCDDTFFEIWSKGGGMIRYDINNGNIITEKIFDIDGYLQQVYKYMDNYLLLVNNSTILLLKDDNVTMTAILSGPIKHAEWSENDSGWHIAGWRELAFLSMEKQSRTAIQEIAVFIDAESGIYLCNDGKWDICDISEEE
tara:strand:+ start:603 stop:1535 length:933 start_codon:yes stop_codon:yes gene_type:complete